MSHIIPTDHAILRWQQRVESSEHEDAANNIRLYFNSSKQIGKTGRGDCLYEFIYNNKIFYFVVVKEKDKFVIVTVFSQIISKKEYHLIDYIKDISPKESTPKYWNYRIVILNIMKILITTRDLDSIEYILKTSFPDIFEEAEKQINEEKT